MTAHLFVNGPSRWCSSGALLTLGLLLGLTTACAHTSRTTPGDIANSPDADTTGASGVAAHAPRVDTAMAPVLTAEEIRRAPGEPVEKLLEGHFAGVTVAQAPDGSLIVRVRGTTTIHGDKDPLYVIDGIPVLTGPSGGLTGIQISEIESIRVLKDPVSTAMYGVRGANGVILITLKQPPRK